MARRDDKIVIRYFAIPNSNKNKGGFLPMIEENGRLRGDTYSGRRPMSREDAELEAHSSALEQAGRYTGDWRVTVRKGDEKYANAALARDVRHWNKKRKG